MGADPRAVLAQLVDPTAGRRIDELREHGAWVRTHVAPWVQRRVTGRSSGDGRTPKRPTLAPVQPAPLP